MGLCKSCFSTKYYGSSPDDRELDPDAQMLIVKNNSKPILISPEPIKQTEETTGLICSSSEKQLERCETGDSGTCVDDGEHTKEKSDSNEGIENINIEQEKDLVQLTVSSVASLSAVAPVLSEDCGENEQDTVTTQISFSAGAGLTLIPESGDSNLINFSPITESDKDVSNMNDSQPSSRTGSISAPLKPAIKSRSSSFGQSCPPPASEKYSSGGKQFIINKVPSKSILSG